MEEVRDTEEDEEEEDRGEREEYGALLSSSMSAAYRSLSELANREPRAMLRSAGGGGGGGGAHTTCMNVMAQSTAQATANVCSDYASPQHAMETNS